jgi:hypothetical protein
MAKKNYKCSPVRAQKENDRAIKKKVSKGMTC